MMLAERIRHGGLGKGKGMAGEQGGSGAQGGDPAGTKCQKTYATRGWERGSAQRRGGHVPPVGPQSRGGEGRGRGAHPLFPGVLLLFLLLCRLRRSTLPLPVPLPQVAPEARDALLPHSTCWYTHPR